MGSPQEQPPARRRVSAEEYLRIENDSSEKHEYRHGEIVAMAGATINHCLVGANLYRAVGNLLNGRPCRVFTSDLRVRVAKGVLYFYPDATVICGPVQADPEDKRGQTVTNPRVVIEILSPSTEAYDRGEKFMHYLKVESLQDYVLVSQAKARVEIFSRREDGTWLFSFASGLDAKIKVPSLGIELSLADLYAGVEFPPETIPPGFFTTLPGQSESPPQTT